LSSNRISQLERGVLERYRHYSSGDRTFDETRGSRDAAAGIPAPQEDAFSFKAEVMAQARSDLNAYNSSCDGYKREVDTRLSELNRQRSEQYVVNRDQLRDEQRRTLDDLEKASGPPSAKTVYARERLARASDAEARINASLGRPLRIGLYWLYIPLMILIAFAEVPINRMAFELFFSETPLVSLGISAVIGILLALFAHLLGTTLKRSFGVRGIKKRLGHFLGAAVIAALVGAVIYAIAVIREQYVRLAEENANVSLDALVGNGIVETARQAMTDGLSTGSLSLIMVNLLLFVGGTAIAFVRHDSDPDYENVVTERQRAEKRLNRLRSAYDKRHSTVSREFGERLSNLERQIGALDEEIKRLETEALELEKHRQKAPATMAAHIENRLLAYQQGNRQARRDGAMPRCFRHYTVTEIEKELMGLGGGSDDNIHRFAR
jgi:hypothetical protein